MLSHQQDVNPLGPQTEKAPPLARTHTHLHRQVSKRQVVSGSSSWYMGTNRGLQHNRTHLRSQSKGHTSRAGAGGPAALPHTDSPFSRGAWCHPPPCTYTHTHTHSTPREEAKLGQELCRETGKPGCTGYPQGCQVQEIPATALLSTFSPLPALLLPSTPPLSPTLLVFRC